MNVQANKVLIFFGTLLFGLIAVWSLGFSFEEPTSKVQFDVPPVEVPFVVPPTNPRQEFRPEFFDLQNFDEDAPSPPDGRLIEMFEGGIYRRSEVYAKNGQYWQVLIEDDQGDYLIENLIASVKPLSSISWPGDEKDARLSFKTRINERIVFAVRGIKGLEAGPVLTLFYMPSGSLNAEGFSENEEMSDGYRREFNFGSGQFVLRTSYGRSKDGTKMALLVVESEGKKQIVKRVPHVPSDDRDIIGSLHWAGDLDDDGKLDFYISEFNEKGATQTELYLSSHAETNQLVGLAGFFAAAGC